MADDEKWGLSREEIFKNGADHCFVPQIWPKLV